MLYIFIIVLIIVLVLVVVLLERRSPSAVKVIKKVTTKSPVVVSKQSLVKEQNKAKIITLLETGQELSNSDIRKVIGVSAATVVRYMDELETEGKVIQIGSTGLSARYRRPD